jgi:Protein of unknown function (DUF2891)
MSSSSSATLDLAAAARFASIALSHVTREQPNVIAHVSPKSVHPIFHGSYDWHSCVHSYWVLATLYRLFPDLPRRHDIAALFSDAFTDTKIEGERKYLERATARGFERPYGWAWLLMLQAELMRHKTREGRIWATRLKPLAALFAARFREHLPKATYPVRSGVHSSTAFALALALEYAGVNDKRLGALIVAKAHAWYSADRDCQAWEPSGEDFLSPALTEAECMRRVLGTSEFRRWFTRFLPRLAKRQPVTLFTPAIVSDRSDGRIVHLDGLNLSRAWCWRNIAASLPLRDPRRKVALKAADAHLAASLPHVSGDYMGEHWLATFALLALIATPGKELAP